MSFSIMLGFVTMVTLSYDIWINSWLLEKVILYILHTFQSYRTRFSPWLSLASRLSPRSYRNHIRMPFIYISDWQKFVRLFFYWFDVELPNLIWVTIHHQVVLLARISLILAFSICPYHPSLSAGFPNYILCQHTAALGKFLPVCQHLDVKRSMGERHFWVRPCFRDWR